MRIYLSLIVILLFCTVAQARGYVDQHAASSLDSSAQSKNKELILFERALSLAKKGQLDQSSAIFSKLLEKNKLSPELYNNLAVNYSAKGELEKSAELLQQVMLLDTAFSTNKIYKTLRNNLIRIYQKQAMLAYQKATDSEPVETSSVETLDFLEGFKGHADAINVVSIPKPVVDKKEKPLNTVALEKDNNAIDAAQTRGINEVVLSWANAWSSQDPERYFSHYVNDFRVPGKLSHKQWKKLRTARLKKPKQIQVSISQVNIKSSSANKAVVVFKQAYKTKRFSDVMRKELQLVQVANSWLIKAEKAAK